MVAVKVNAFGGMIPATDARLLPDRAAALSQDVWLYDGSLKGFAQPSLVRQLTNPNAGKVYRIPVSFADAAHFANATWMEFANIDTDVVRCPVVGDVFGRYYWACPTDVPRVNSLANIQAGNVAPYPLGVPQPAGAPTLSITGGVSSTVVSRAYALTYVTNFNEEGPPSTPVVGNGKIDATWTVNFAAPSGAAIAAQNLKYVNVYRTVTSSSGVATYFFVAQLPVTSTSYADTATDTSVSANNQLQSTTWTAPPNDLQGLISMPNGMIAGWRGSEVWFCEPYRPHAWPAQYALAVEYPIVGLGVIGQTLVILTQGYPILATGINPSGMTLSTLSTLEPCMSRGSIVSTPDGVYYASPNGLILIANGVATNVTQQLIQKDAWNAYLTVGTLRATRLGTAYYCFGSARPGVFQTDTFKTDTFQQQDYSGSQNGVYIDIANQTVAFNTLTADVPITNVFSDPWSGETCLIYSGGLYRIDLQNGTGPRRPFVWRSKMFQPTDRKNFGALRVYFDVPPWAPTQSPARNTSSPQTLQTNQYGLVRVFADGRLVMTRELRTSGELMKIPSGFKADFWQIEVTGYVAVTQFQMATSDKELKKV
jgi:hypothetical protein